MEDRPHRKLPCTQKNSHGERTCQRKQQVRGLCKHHYRLVMRGKPTGLVDFKPASEHIRALGDMGVSQQRVSQLTGIPQHTIWRIANGQRKRMLAVTAERIMQVPLPDTPWAIARPNASVPIIGTQRRVRALRAAGFTSDTIAARLGVNKRAVTQISNADPGNDYQSFVTARVARTAAALFEEWRLIDGPSDTARKRAAAKGWDLPSAWDVDEIDNPDAKPCKPQDYWYEEYQDLVSMGYPFQDICRILKINEENLRLRLKRRGRKSINAMEDEHATISSN